MVKRQKADKKGGKTPAKGSGSMYATGDDIIAKAKADAQKKKMEAEKRKAGTAFRFFVPQGEEKEIVILDAKVQDGLGVKQHRLKDAKGHWNRYEPCIGADDNCPICKAGNRDSYTIMLSCLDLSGYTDKKGNEVEYSKRLLPITSNQLEVFLDLQESNGGSLRGMYLVMKRDDSDKSYSIGSPKPLKGGKTYQVYSEEELVENFGNAPKKDKKTGDLIKKRNEDITSFNYKKLFPEPTEEYIDALRDEFDEGNHPAGSRKSNAKSWDDEDDDDEPKSKKGRLRPDSKKPKKPVDDDEDEEEDEDDSDDEETPRSKKKPVKPSRARDDDEDDTDDEEDDEEEEEDDDSDDEEDEDDAPKGRRAAKPSSKKAKRTVRDRDEDEEESDDDSDDSDEEEEEEDSDDEEETKPAKKGKASAKSKPKKPVDDDEDEEEDEDDSDDEEEEEDDEPKPKKTASAKKKPFRRR